jgi:hypothetical protein
MNISKNNVYHIKSGDTIGGTITDTINDTNGDTVGGNELTSTDYKSDNQFGTHQSSTMDQRERIIDHLKMKHGKSHRNAFSIFSGDSSELKQDTFSKKNDAKLAHLYNAYFKGDEKKRENKSNNLQNYQ